MSNKPASELLIAATGLKSCDQDVLETLSAILRYSLENILVQSAKRAKIANRSKINVFDVASTFSHHKVTITTLLHYLAKTARSRKTAESNLNRSQADEMTAFTQSCISKLKFGETQALSGGTKLENYYPPIPQAYTFKNTPLYGKREEDSIKLLKRLADEKKDVEANLYRIYQFKHAQEDFNPINYENL